MCLPCRVNTTTIIEADRVRDNAVISISTKVLNALERKKAAEQAIEDRRAEHERAAATPRPPRRRHRPPPRSTKSKTQPPITTEDRATNAAENVHAPTTTERIRTTEAVEPAARNKRTDVPAKEELGTARARLQKQWNNRLG